MRIGFRFDKKMFVALRFGNETLEKLPQKLKTALDDLFGHIEEYKSKPEGEYKYLSQRGLLYSGNVSEEEWFGNVNEMLQDFFMSREGMDWEIIVVHEDGDVEHNFMYWALLSVEHFIECHTMSRGLILK